MAGGSYSRSGGGNAHLNPAVSYAFALQVEAAFFIPLKSVRVFTKENEFDYYQEGGLNDYVHMLRKPVTKPFTFQIERYVGVSSSGDFNMGFLDPLALGTELILPLVLYVNRSPAGSWYKNISFENCARAYIFTGCVVTAKEFGELNAEQSKLLTETTTIAYRELFTINQISPAWEKGETWEYDGSVAGKGESHTENRSKNRTAADGTKQGEANKWVFDGTVAGSGKAHINNRSKGRTAEEGATAGEDNKWVFTDDVKGDGAAHDLNRSHNRSRQEGQEEGEANKWVYDGTVKGQGASHTSNRNTNTRPEPVKWPPTRRALKAQALSEL